MKMKIYPGRRYNKIVVLEKIKHRLWKCKCDCGDILEVSTPQLGRIVHCKKNIRLSDEIYEQRLKNRLINSVSINNECWEWLGQISKLGYGCTSYRSKSMPAHRVSWIAFKGDIPSKINVCHRCDNRKCINPDHLFLGSQKENMQDCFNKNRKSHKGEKHPGVKISEKQVIEIFELRRMGWTHQKLADRFRVSQGTISNVLHRRIWKHVKVEVLWADLANGSSVSQTN